VQPVRARLAEQFTDALIGYGIEPGFTLIELAINPLLGGHDSIQDATEAADKGGDEGWRPRPRYCF
jgi:hypothetical protein